MNQFYIKSSVLAVVALTCLLPKPALADACFRIAENTLAQPIVGEKLSSFEQAALSLKKGQIYPGEAANDNVNVFNDGKKYSVKKAFAKAVALNTCFSKPICLVVKNDASALKYVTDPNGPSIKIYPGEKFSAVATKKYAESDRMFLVNQGFENYWINLNDVTAHVNKTCDQFPDVKRPAEVVQTAKTSPSTSIDRYVFGLEAGTGSNYGSTQYDGFITEVPDPSNVGALPNPIITEIKKGSGFYVGPLLDIRFSEKFKIKIGTLYQENKFTYLGKSNPTTAANSLSSLPNISGELSNQSVVFSISPSYEMGTPKHRLGLGVSLRIHYYFSKASTITFRRGTVFKAEEYTVAISPKQFDPLSLLTVYYQWNPRAPASLGLRSSLETDGKVMQLGLSVFY